MGFKMVKTNIIFYIMFILLLVILSTSCFQEQKSNQLDFILIDKEFRHYSQDEYNYKSEKRLSISRLVLIKNPPSNNLQAVMLKYWKEYWKEHQDSIDLTCKRYSIAFYLYNAETSVYQHRDYRNDINGITYYRDGSDPKYALGGIIAEPCVSDSSMWTISVMIVYERENDYSNYKSYISFLDSCTTLIGVDVR